MTNEVEYIRATAEECQAEIDAVLNVNPALEYEIIEQGVV